MDRRRKRIIAFLQQEGGRAGRPRCAAAAATIGIRSGGKVDSVLSSPVFVGAAAVVEEFARLPRSREVGMDRGGRRETKWRPGGDGSSAFCGAFHIGSVLTGAWGSPLPPSPHSLGPLLLLRPFQSLRVDVKIAPSPLELAPMEPIGRPDDELQGGRGSLPLKEMSPEFSKREKKQEPNGKVPTPRRF